MFFVFACLFLLCLSVGSSLPDASPNTWETFKREFNKTYSNQAEEAKRQNIFFVNVKLIEDHNKKENLNNKDQHSGYYLQVNQFADLTHDEIVNKVTSPFQERLVKHGSLTNNTMSWSPYLVFPNEIDWRKEGFVSPVKDQGSCKFGSVFAAVGAMEGQERGRFSSLVPLSPQQLYDCCGTGSCSGCPTGGALSPTEYFECVDDIVGLDSDKCYPYTGKCHQCLTSHKCISVGINGYTEIESGNEESLKQAVAMKGPVAVRIHGSLSSFIFFSGTGIYNDPWCSSSKLDHAVTVVGYGVQGSTPYWLIKNSWGTRWGDQGYAKIIRSKNMCGIATKAVYPHITTN